jgi:hypothetical protein
MKERQFLNEFETASCCALRLYCFRTRAVAVTLLRPAKLSLLLPISGFYQSPKEAVPIGPKPSNSSTSTCWGPAVSYVIVGAGLISC